ncbi:MAG: LEA type 2 family protein [Chitinophagales bacterium]|nr:LEA type 2 family protein [Chitinophagales bacterium]MDW8428167.1 LEA type 2 family protein [Chitinophagales bacterium]
MKFLQMKEVLMWLGLFHMALASCASLKPLEPKSLSEVTLRNGARPRVEAEFRLYNPNRMGATLLPSTLDFRLEGVRLASLQLEQTRMKARADVVVPFSAEITYGDLVAAVPAVAISLLADRRLNLEIEGTVRVRKFLFTRQYPIALRQDVRLRDLRLR